MFLAPTVCTHPHTHLHLERMHLSAARVQRADYWHKRSLRSGIFASQRRLSMTGDSDRGHKERVHEASRTAPICCHPASPNEASG